MIKEVNKIKEIPIYHDDHLEKEILFGYKTENNLNNGYILVPTNNLKEIKSAEIEKEKVDKILKMKREHKLSDINFIICNYKGIKTIKVIEKLLKDNFKMVP